MSNQLASMSKDVMNQLTENKRTLNRKLVEVDIKLHEVLCDEDCGYIVSGSYYGLSLSLTEIHEAA